MSSLNQVHLVGRVGRKPELRSTTSGTAVVQFSLATNETWRDREGNPVERTQWHRVVAWGPTAQAVAEHVEIGRQLLVQGALRTRDWTDQQGVKRYVTEVHSSRVLFLGARSSAGEADAAAPAPDDAPASAVDEIPF